MYRGLIVSLSVAALSFTHIDYSMLYSYCQIDTKEQDKRYEPPSTTNMIITTNDTIWLQHNMIMNSILANEARKEIE